MNPIVLILPNNRYKRYEYDKLSGKMKLDIHVQADMTLTSQEVEQFRTNPQSMM